MEVRYIWCPNPSVWWSRCAHHRTFWQSVYDLRKFRADTSSWFSRSRRSLDARCRQSSRREKRHLIQARDRLGAARGSVHCVGGSAACALARGGWGITSARKHQLASVERHHIVIKVTLRYSWNNVLVKRLFNVSLTLIKRWLNVILPKFKRYSNVIPTSLSPKTCHWDSPGGDTASFVLSFYHHYPLSIIPLHYKSYFCTVSICDNIWGRKKILHVV